MITATELARVEKILKSQPAFRSRLGRKVSVEKRTGEVVSFRTRTIAVAKALMAQGFNPERAQVRVVLRVATEVFRIPRRGAVVSGAKAVNSVAI
jgi:hypothetical protein